MVDAVWMIPPMHPYYADDWGSDWDEPPADPWSFYTPIQPWDLMEPMGLEWSSESYPYDPSYEEIVALVEEIAISFVERHAPLPPPRPNVLAFMPETIVGWSPPPHPVDVVVSFDPRASKKEKAAAVLLDYYHDDQLRSWADDGNVKKCFIGGSDPKKEDHDPLLLVAAHADPHHKVWKCQGVSWKSLDDAVQGAIGRRTKLGPLPKSSYDLGPNNTNPVVIYYYDHNTMKRITYPPASIPEALRLSMTSPTAHYWAAYSGPNDAASVDAGLDKIHTLQTADPRKIKIERENPGWKNKEALKKILAKYASEFQHSGDCPTCKGTLGMGSIQAGSAGGWDDEGFDWDRDVAGTGIIGTITGAIMALVTAIGSAVSFGALAVPLGVATALVVAAVNEIDMGLHTGDWGAGLAGLATALLQGGASAAGAAGVSLPPEAVKALGGTVSAIATAVRAGQEKKLDFVQIWDEAAKKAKGYGKLGDEEAIALAQMLSGKGPAVGHVFIQGYLAGKFLDLQSIASIVKLLEGYKVFADPRIINLGILGMGIGHIAKSQGGSGFAPSKSARASKPRAARPAHATKGDFEIEIGFDREPVSDLMSFVREVLVPRYGIGGAGHVVGLSCPEGYDVVSSDHGIACAYRRRVSCLGGHTDYAGRFVCTQHDYPECPRGMTALPGKPENWCFPVESGPTFSGAGHFVGDGPLPPPPVSPPPDFGPLSRGCPAGSWWDPFQQICRPAQPLPQPSPRMGGA